jgi:hypothetical protein
VIEDVGWTMMRRRSSGGMTLDIASSMQPGDQRGRRAAWGFATTALDSKPTPVARLGSAIGAAAIVLTAAARTARLRRTRARGDDSEPPMSAPIA